MWLVLVVFAGLAPGLLAQDEGRTLQAFQKLFKAKKDKTATVAEQVAAIATLKDYDSPAVADALIAAWLAVETEAAGVDAERDRLGQELATILKGQENSEHRSFPAEVSKRYHELHDLLPKMRDEADALRDLQQKLGARLGTLQRKDTLLALLAKVLPGKKTPLPLRLAAAKALGAGASAILPELAAALDRAREPEELLALIEVMGAAGAVAKPHATPVIALLQSPHEAVRERAAQALAKIAVPEAVEPMIAALVAASGQTRLRIATALEILTGQQFGINVASWQAWWQAEGAGVRAGQQPLGSGKPSQRNAADRNYYFGIPQDQSNSILYVIDCSGSMTKKIKLHLPQQGATVANNGAEQETTRLEGCKTELIRALGMLRPKQKFGILWFNDQPHFWQPTLQAADKPLIEQAQAFVKTLQPSSTTNIHDTLEQAFKLVGRGQRDRYYGVELDTVFLLTDGSPTRSDGKPDSTDKVIEAVRGWNPLKRVTIHTIGIGGEINDSFLGQLASENGGEYKKF